MANSMTRGLLKPINRGCVQILRCFCTSRKWDLRGDGGERNGSGLDLLELESQIPKRHKENDKNPTVRINKKRYEKDTDVKFLSRKYAKQFNVQGEVLFGHHPVVLALKRRKRDFHRLYLSSKLTESNNAVIRNILSLANQMDVPLNITSNDVLDRLSAGRPHQGTCLDVSAMKYEILDEDSLSNQSVSPQLWLVLDRIVDPMNFGAIIRSSYFFGVDRLLAVRRSCKLSPVVSKASSGTMEILDVARINELSHFIKTSVNLGWDVVATSSRMTPDYGGRSKYLSVDEFQLSKNTIVIFGNEGSGVAAHILDLCSKFVYIEPHPGISENLESLNVSVSAGVLLHSLTKQRRSKS